VDDVALTVNDDWTNSLGDRYPASWTLEIPSVGIRLEILPVLEDQELDTTVRYWEGAVDVKGARAGEPLSGRGYVELTGYSQ